MATLDRRDGDGEVLRLVGFRIEDWRFAVRLAQVQTSVMPSQVTRVHHMPPFVQGIISLRGTIVCVLDLGNLLGLPSSGSAPQRFIVVSADGAQAAIPVHDVFRVPDVTASVVEPQPPSMDASHREFLTGVINLSTVHGTDRAIGEDTLTVLDVGALFSSPRIRALRGLR